MNLRLLLIFYSLIFLSCKNNTSATRSSQGESFADSEPGEIVVYEDGTYCAEVEYYYSNTGTNSTYTLSVEVEGNQLIRIDWPNGGWLDDSHFTPPEIEDGAAEFTSDKGVDYTVTIIGVEGDCNLSSNAIDESSLIDRYNEEEYQEELDAQEQEMRLKEEEEEIRLREEQEEQERELEEQETQAEEFERSEDEGFTIQLDTYIINTIFSPRFLNNLTQSKLGYLCQLTNHSFLQKVTEPLKFNCFYLINHERWSKSPQLILLAVKSNIHIFFIPLTIDY